MSRRKDRERFSQLKQRNPAYLGFRGTTAAPARAAEETVGVVCSVCRRKRNVPASSLPKDHDTYVCLQCQEHQGTTPLNLPLGKGEKDGPSPLTKGGLQGGRTSTRSHSLTAPQGAGRPDTGRPG